VKNLLAKIYKALNLPKGVQIFVMRFFQDRFLIGVTGIIFNEKREVLLKKIITDRRQMLQEQNNLLKLLSCQSDHCFLKVESLE